MRAPDIHAIAGSSQDAPKTRPRSPGARVGVCEARPDCPVRPEHLDCRVSNLGSNRGLNRDAVPQDRHICCLNNHSDLIQARFGPRGQRMEVDRTDRVYDIPFADADEQREVGRELARALSDPPVRRPVPSVGTEYGDQRVSLEWSRDVVPLAVARYTNTGQARERQAIRGRVKCDGRTSLDQAVDEVMSPHLANDRPRPTYAHPTRVGFGRPFRNAIVILPAGPRRSRGSSGHASPGER